MEAKDILIKYWGHTAFRLNQEEIIQQVINSNDTLALLPTGGGKSICFQIPAIMQEGICIVISPLIALMTDQVKHLKSKGIKSVAITSGMYKSEIDTALTNCIYGGVKFLYLSPERLQNIFVKQKIKEMNVNLITVDEAHCISEWGHDFRPAYRHITQLRELHPNVPVLALTATATSEVIIDIQENLNFKRNNLMQSSFFRKNLSYVVSNVEDKNKTLLRLLNKIKSSVIIYVSNRKSCKIITNFLLNNHISANYYHGGLNADQRDKRQKNWTNNNTRVMVATNAFGMGIDKSDVRLVVHLDLPDTIEAYFQQAGRAGRDGEIAYAFLLANTSDIKKKMDLLEMRYPNLDEIKTMYQHLVNHLQIAENSLSIEPFSFDLHKFCNRYELNNFKTYNILKYLEKEEILRLSEALHTPSKIKIKVSNPELYQFQIAHKFYDTFLKLLLRSYEGLFNNFVAISEYTLAERANKTADEVITILTKLHHLEILEYVPKNENAHITFLTARKDVNNLPISEQKLKERKALEKDKIQAIIDYTEDESLCRSLQLLLYFGEKQNDRCGICDICVKTNRKEIAEKEFKLISEKIKMFLEDKEHTLDEISAKLNNIHEPKLIKIIQYLFDNDIIEKFGNKYRILS